MLRRIMIDMKERDIKIVTIDVGEIEYMRE
jgi:hypothetical protein